MRYNVIDKIENIVFLHQEEREITENEVTSLQLFYDFDEAPQNTERYDFVPITYPYTADYLEPRFNFDTLVWYEGATQQEVITKQIEKETVLYEKRIQDGTNIVSFMSAKLRVLKSVGIFSEEEHIGIENILLPTRTELMAGQFISALRLLEPLQPQLPAPLYNEAHKLLSDYVYANYD